MEAIHAARECAQLALLDDAVAAADVVERAGGQSVVEVVIHDNRVPPRLLALLADWDLALDPDATATRGDPTHTVVVVAQ